MLIALLIVALIISVSLNLMKAGGTVTPPAPAKQTLVVAGDLNTKVAVVPVEGIIDDEMALRFDHLLGQVEKDSAAKALVIRIDTPGGSASSSDEMYHRLDQFKTRTGGKVPVVISMGGMATSGGYYVACAGDYIFAEDETLTGNIGVLFPRFNVSKFINDHGIA